MEKFSGIARKLNNNQKETTEIMEAYVETSLGEFNTHSTSNAREEESNK